MTRIVLDVDSALGIEGGDIDDAHAILFAAAHQPPLEIVGVTVVGGNVTLPSASRSTRLVCELCKLDVPISEGASRPADRELSTGHSRLIPKEHGERWIFNREPVLTAAKTNAIEALAAAAEAGEFDILAVGPLTNIAAFLTAHPQHKPRIRRIVTMGGWYTDADRNAEFNIATDPPAAAAVYGAGIPMVVVPFDMTRRTLLRPADIEPWKKMGDAAKLFHDGTMNWMSLMHSKYNLDGCHLHDPLAAAYCVYPELFKLRGIVPEIDQASGRTEIKRYDDNSPIKLVSEFDNLGFINAFRRAAERVFAPA